MNQPVRLALLTLALSMSMGRSFAVPAAAPHPEGIASAQAAAAAAQLAAAEAELRNATEALRSTRRQVAQGLATERDVSTIQAQIARSRAAVEEARAHVALQQRQQQQSDRIAALKRPIDVEIRDVDLNSAARKISQASGITVSVDPTVRVDHPVSIIALGMPLAAVLDVLARQNVLLISPAPDGVLLKPLPSLEVNGQRSFLAASFGPWSTEWGTDPAELSGFGTVPGGFVSAGGFGGGVLNDLARAGSPTGQGLITPPGSLPGREAPLPRPGQPETIPPPPRSPGANPFRPFGSERNDGPARDGFAAAMPGPPPISITPLGDNTFVVAHPAPAPDGGPAIMLTVYRLDGMQQLRMVSSTLHRLGPAAGLPGSRQMSAPRSNSPHPAPSAATPVR
jgi:hypothetical protein